MEHSSLDAAAARILRLLPGRDQTTASPVLVVVSGLPGTGKSYLAHRIAERMPSVIVESDMVRRTLFPVPSYSGLESMWVHRVAHAIIASLLATGHRVIYDATNLVEWHRQKVYYIAEQQGAKLVIVRTVAPEDIVRIRLQRRRESPDPDDLSDAGWEVYEHLKKRAEPIRRSHLVVHTDGDLSSALSKIVRAMRAS